jgi:2-C-methyl-D-erythritol 4-phosphate cytidylyltransferase/2-C-methyl-D-erythritol 2,4-cyclodiphosphate synthase
MKISVIICAAGKGERAGLGKNKLLCPIQGAPVLYHTLNKFRNFEEIIVTSSPEDKEEIEAICTPFNAKVVLGGSTRTQSVYNALKQVSGEVVLIHDGARPYVTKKVIDDCISSVIEHGSGICAQAVTDTIVSTDGGKITSVPDRDKLFSVQTPQGFFTKDIVAAYEKGIKSQKQFTDDSSVYSEYICPAHIFLGDGCNKKITYKTDFDGQYPAMNAAQGQAIGIGIDVHSFGKKQDFVTLCGVKIPCDSGLIAHSDGDVAIHALMDAILSAAGLRDIGHYFPDTSPEYKDANSLDLLKETVAIALIEGYVPLNLSITIQAEKPRLANYIPLMVQNIAKACRLDITKVAVSAGTSEKLGFVGEGLGICATAIALLSTPQRGK